MKKWIKYLLSIPAMGLEQPKAKQALMTFEQAEKELRKIADKRYCSLRYKRTYHRGEFIEQECYLYMEDHCIITRPTWEQAFVEFKKLINRSTDKPSISPSPKETINGQDF